MWIERDLRVYYQPYKERRGTINCVILLFIILFLLKKKQSPSTSQHIASPDSDDNSINNSDQASQQQRTKWKSMEDVSNVEEIGTLSVTELKQILTANFINYKGCVEKKELVDKVIMLFRSIEENKKRQG